MRCSLGIAYINTLPPPVTGDQRPTLPRREKLGIAEVEDLPDQKSVVVTRLHKARRIVAMAEHGVNDATALVAADVGVAMGTGMNDAMESVGVTLLRAISAASSALPVSRGQRCATSVRTCSLRLSITQQESNRGGCALPDIQPVAVADHRRSRDGVVIGDCRRKCT